MVIQRVSNIKYTETIPHRNNVYSSSNVQVTRLNIGLTIITETKPHSPSAGINIFVNVGSVYEDDKTSGATHFLEHMVFRRTKNRTGRQISEEAARAGASINAATSEEYTHYFTEVLSENVTVPTLIYLDMLLNNSIDKKEFNIEKGAVLEEAKTDEDTPEDRIATLAQETYFKGHPYGRRIIGTQETISRMRVDDLERFSREHYTPDNMCVSIAGNIDGDKEIKEIEKITSHITRKIKRQDIPPLQLNIENAIEDMKIQQAHIVLLSKAYSISDEKKNVLDVLDQAFGSDVSSRLFTNIRDKTGYCYSISSKANSCSFGGDFTVYGGFRKDKAQEGIELILNEMRKIRKNGLTPDELERAKILLRTETTTKREANISSSYINGYNYILSGHLVPIEEIDGKIKLITNEQIIEVANEVFNPAFLAAYIVGPKRNLPKRIDIR